MTLNVYIIKEESMGVIIDIIWCDVYVHYILKCKGT